jgi:phage tail sheath protein FI
MAATLSYPGVYVEEIPSGVRTITGVSTSNTAFVDFFPRGPINQPVRITSYGDFERRFGGLNAKSEASYGIKQYYLNGGQVAFVVRAQAGAAAATKPRKARINLTNDGNPPGGGNNVVFIVEAIDEGDWGNAIEVAVDHQTANDPATGAPKGNEFNLAVREIGTVGGRKQVVRQEIHRNLSMDTASPRSAVQAIEADSQLIRLIEQVNPGMRPGPTTVGTAVVRVTDAQIVTNVAASDPVVAGSGGGSGGANPNYVFRSQKDASAQTGVDGDLPDSTGLEAGWQALDTIAPEIFNILCLPRAADLDAASYNQVVGDAAKYCRDKRAFFVVDLPSGVKAGDDVLTLRDQITFPDGSSANAALYFPRVFVADPLNENRARNFGASGTIAGIYAATDASRGVWKAPAGTDATLGGATLAATLTDLDNGGLNPFGINVLRTFPIFGNVVWGARTLQGADIQASEWKYIPVRRTALFLEESLYQGLKWVVFEPNDEPLWAQIRLNVGAFMHNLFRQGAFQGNTPSKAYLVKCDSETTTQNDVDLGIVNIVVGFAPLKPAEFVVLKIQQLAGQIEV